MVAVKEDYNKAPMGDTHEESPITREYLLAKVMTFLAAAKMDIVKFLLHELLDGCLNNVIPSDHFQSEETKQNYMAYLNYKGDQARAILMEHGTSYKDFPEEKQTLREAIEQFLNDAEYLFTATVKSIPTKELLKEFKEYLKPE